MYPLDQRSLIKNSKCWATYNHTCETICPAICKQRKYPKTISELMSPKIFATKFKEATLSFPISAEAWCLLYQYKHFSPNPLSKTLPCSLENCHQLSRSGLPPNQIILHLSSNMIIPRKASRSRKSNIMDNWDANRLGTWHWQFLSTRMWHL